MDRFISELKHIEKPTTENQNKVNAQTRKAIEHNEKTKIDGIAR